MPDTFSHLLLTALFKRCFRPPIYPPLVLIGVVLPDYLREFFALLLSADHYHTVVVFHSLIGLILSSLFFSAFFTKSIRTNVFLSLLSGQIIHIVVDLLQFYQCGGQFYLFLPFWHSFQFGLIPESMWLTVFFVSVFLYLIYELYFLRRQRRHSR